MYIYIYLHIDIYIYIDIIYISYQHETLYFDKSESADIKYDNSISQIPSQKYPNKTFFCPTRSKKHTYRLKKIITYSKL